jgi:hypothetical protein
MNQTYVYIRSEPGLYTVGFYTPNGKWEPESDHKTQEEAANQVNWLNGGKPKERPVPCRHCGHINW